MFAGYAFPVAAGAFGCVRVTIPFAILFALMHLATWTLVRRRPGRAVRLNWVKLGRLARHLQHRGPVGCAVVRRHVAQAAAVAADSDCTSAGHRPARCRRAAERVYNRV